MKPALLVVDVQNAFFKISPETARSLEEAIDYINAAIELFRDKNLPVVAVQHMNEKRGLKPGSEGFEIPGSVILDPSDPRITKTYGNSFNKTPLAGMLRERAVDTVVITGFCAENCVLSTYRGAQDHDFKPVLLRGALASDEPAHIRFVEEINDLVSIGALRALLG